MQSKGFSINLSTHKSFGRKHIYFLLYIWIDIQCASVSKKPAPVSRVIGNAANWSAKNAALKFHVCKPPKSCFYLAALCCQGRLKGTLISGVLARVYPPPHTPPALCCQPAGRLRRTLNRRLLQKTHYSGGCGATFAPPQLWLRWMNPPPTDLITLSHGFSSAPSKPFISFRDHRKGRECRLYGIYFFCISAFCSNFGSTF